MLIMWNSKDIPVFPSVGAAVLRLAPLAPLSLAGARLAKTLVRRHPSLFARLGEQAEKTFLIDPTDLPFAFRLTPRVDNPRLEAVRREDAGAWEARIGGPLAALLGLVHGVYDGDALFFSRDLVIEGDTEAVLALRNAIDNEEIDLAAEVAAFFGPLEHLAAAPARRVSSLVGHLFGIALTRSHDESHA
jgi:predicted lipid carrier protein YhbT